MRPALVVLCALVFVAAALASAPRARVAVRSTALGSLLVDSRGHTLYAYDHGRSANTTVWPPFLTSTKPVGVGVPARKLGVVKVAGGKLQVTFAGHPLYFYAGDTKAGDVRGAAIASWAALTAGGAKVRAPKVPAPTTTTNPYPYPYDPGGGY